jgi:cyanophycinase
MHARLCLLFSLLAVSPLTAQPPKAKPLPGDGPIGRYLKDDTRAISERFLDGAKTRAEWEKRLPRLRREYLDMLGLWPLPEKTPLKATVTGTVERGEVVIEKLHYQSRPGLYVTGNLYRPKSVTGTLPAILYVCGHSGRGRDGNKTAFQDHGMWFARNGYICLIVDTLQLGEVAGKHHGTYNLGRWGWHSLAYTPAGVECWNGIRGIDYLISRPDVDAERIGVTGISGGGASTVWIAAADERVKVAVPVSGMSDLQSYVSNKVINGHCDCMFLVNTYRWEWTTIAALIAPRPMLFANSDNDPIFPMDGNRRIIARLRQVYRMYDKPDLVDEHVSKGGHDYRPDLRLAVFKWFHVHLKKDKSDIKDADDPPLPGKELRVFPEDTDLPRDALNARIDEVFVARGEVKLPQAKDFLPWKESLMKQLRERSFRTFPDRIGAPKGAIVPGTEWGLKGGALLSGEANLPLTINPPVVRAASPRDTGLLVLLNEDEDESKGLPAWARELAGKREVQLLSTRGMGAGKWTNTSPPNYVARSDALLGRTVDQGRVWDAITTVRWLQAMRGRSNWAIAGRGRAGILAAYAALFEPSITDVTVVDPPASHRDGPYFLGVLRVLDIPEALGLLAPRPLTLIGAREDEFTRTARIYKLAGAMDRLKMPATKRSHIVPSGIPGALVLCGEGKVSDDAVDRFFEWAGDAKGEVIILAAGKGNEVLHDRLKERAEANKGPHITIVKVSAAGAAQRLDKANGVWLTGPAEGIGKALSGTALEEACQKVLQRGGVLAARSDGAGLMGRLALNGGSTIHGTGFLPDCVITMCRSGHVQEHQLTELLKQQPFLVGCEIGPGSALAVRGRRMGVVGGGKVTIYLAPSATRSARQIALIGPAREDLTALRRSARARSELPFPPAKPAAPVVEKGTLIIVGGGGVPRGLSQQFVNLAGGKKARIVVLPIAIGDTGPGDGRIASAFRKAGAQKVTVLTGRTRAEVESDEFLDALSEATGIWFGGGRQWRFVDAYEGTKALPLMFNVLRKGGVIAGSSAGATIQGDYLCRGGVFNNFDIIYEGYERGLGFLPGVAIDQHFSQRKRQKDMTALVKVYPQLLGIGIDEATAIIVRGHTADVVGRGQIHFYDSTRPVENGKPDHVSVGDGGRYDLKERKVLSRKEE